MKFLLVFIGLAVVASAFHMHDVTTREWRPKPIMHFDYIPTIPV